jgi:hypothetical protein
MSKNFSKKEKFIKQTDIELVKGNVKFLVVNYRLLGSLKYDRLNIKIFSSSY